MTGETVQVDSWQLSPSVHHEMPGDAYTSMYGRMDWYFNGVDASKPVPVYLTVDGLWVARFERRVLPDEIEDALVEIGEVSEGW